VKSYTAFFVAVATCATPLAAFAAAQTFDLQLVNICEGALDCPPPGIDEGFLQSIYSQIDISVNVLSTITNNDLILQRADDGSGQIVPVEETMGFVTGGALGQFTDSFRQPVGFGFDIAPNTVYMGITGDLVDPVLGVAFLDAASQPFGV